MSMLTRRREMMIEESWLPEGCVELEYLENNGTQWLNTNEKYYKGIYINASFELPSSKAVWESFLGWTNLLKLIRYAFDDVIRIEHGSSSIFRDFSIKSGRVNIEIDTEAGYFSMNGDKRSAVFSTTEVNLGMLIFSSLPNQPGGVETPSKCKMYSVTVGNSNFLPILDSSGRPCMYDTIGKQYYYNQGTGEFSYKIKE